MKQTSVYITASEICEVLGVSRNKGYSIVNDLNVKMKKEVPTSIIIRGKVNRKFFEEAMFGKYK